MDSITDQVRLVAQLRAGTRAVAEHLAAKRAAWETDNALLIDQVALCQRDLAEAEIELRRHIPVTGDGNGGPCLWCGRIECIGGAGCHWEPAGEEDIDAER